MPNKLWKPLNSADEAIDRYATRAAESLAAAEERRHEGDLDEHYLRLDQEGHYLTAIAYLVRALKEGEDPDQVAAMVPTLLDPSGPADTWANILTPAPTGQN